MILTRLSTAIRTQNWFAVILEFVIVIAGVVIGFQITAWNAERQDQARANLYLERLLTDVRENQRRTQNDFNFRSDVRALGRAALDYSAQRQPVPDPWQVVATYFNASQAGSSTMVRSTFDELVATGDQRLLGDLELRNQINAYFTRSEVRSIVAALPEYRRQVRTIIPAPLQEYILTTCFVQDRDGQSQSVFDCPRPDDEADYSQLASRLLSDEALNGELRFWVSTQQVALEVYAGDLDVSQDLIVALETALGDHQ